MVIDAAWPRFPVPAVYIEAFVVLAVALMAHLTFYWNTPVIIWPHSVRYANLSSGFFHRLAIEACDLWTSPGYPFFLWLCHYWVHTTRGVVFIQQALADVACVLIWVTARKSCGSLVALVGGLV